MRAFFNRYADSIAYFFDDADNHGAGARLPRVEPHEILKYEREILLAIRNGVDQQNNESIKVWIRALVHSTVPDQVKEGIDVLTSIHEFEGKRWVIIKDVLMESPLNDREKYYYSAVGHYRSGYYLQTMELLKKCLEIDNGCRKALFLKKLTDRKMRKDAVKLMSVASFSLGLVAFGTIVALIKKKKVNF